MKAALAEAGASQKVNWDACRRSLDKILDAPELQGMTRNPGLSGLLAGKVAQPVADAIQSAGVSLDLQERLGDSRPRKSGVWSAGSRTPRT